MSTSTTTDLVREKVAQATALLNEHGVDAWLVFVRETSLTPDPCLPLLVGQDMVWQSAFVLHRSGRHTALVGRYDAENIRQLGAYAEVIGYDEDYAPALRQILATLDPAQVALNYSPSDPAADGLTHGLWLSLNAALAETTYPARFISAEGLVAGLRGRKSPTEVSRIRAAIAATEDLFGQLHAALQPGWREHQVADFLHSHRRALGAGTAWDEPYCPTVNAGPDSVVGHTAPAHHVLQAGHLLHVDFGLKLNDYCADLQRMWYCPHPGQTTLSAAVARAWEACWAAVDAGAAQLRPGTPGWQVDAAARATLESLGYPAYQHALGHQLGRVAHDGATLLGPRWARYGNAPLGQVEVGQVYTLELGVAVPGHGYIGLEEDVLVTATGLDWLSQPQRELWWVGAPRPA